MNHTSRLKIATNQTSNFLRTGPDALSIADFSRSEEMKGRANLFETEKRREDVKFSKTRRQDPKRKRSKQG